MSAQALPRNSTWDGAEIECDRCTAKGLPPEGCRRCDGHGYLWGNTSLARMTELARCREHHALLKWYQKNFANEKGQIF